MLFGTARKPSSMLTLRWRAILIPQNPSAVWMDLDSFNVRDYCRLHAEFLVQGRSHAGIILAKQQQYSVGEQMRRLLKLIATKPAEQMTNELEFLGNWE